MALIIAARFNTFDAAQTAAGQLMAAGITADNLHTFFVNPAGSHDRYPMGGDEAVDPGSKGGSMGALVGAALIGIVGAGVGAVVGYAFGSSTIGIMSGAGVGAYIGSLAGAMQMVGRKRTRRIVQADGSVRGNESRPAGVLLAVNAASEDQQNIARILREAGGREVERAQGRWEDGVWKDFDPLETPTLEKGL